MDSLPGVLVACVFSGPVGILFLSWMLEYGDEQGSGIYGLILGGALREWRRSVGR